MKNVVGISSNIVPNNEPVPEVIEVLEEFLAAAKDGSLRSIAIAGIRANGHAFTSWEDGGKGAWAMLGAMEWLKDRVLTQIRNKDQ